jgi:hypothetical protein
VIRVNCASSGEGGDEALHAAIGKDAQRIPSIGLALRMQAF